MSDQLQKINYPKRIQLFNDLNTGLIYELDGNQGKSKRIN
jgi:hypothetical protein